MLKRDMPKMVLPFGRTDVNIYGGPYRQRPLNIPGVKMAVEIRDSCDVDIPTEDFNVPKVADLKRGLFKTLWLLRTRGHIYVGCMGGIGRTGLFMAVLTRVLTGVGGPDSIAEVRRQYKAHAVETDQQQDYVANFPIRGLRLWAKIMGIGIT
jgi:hypothetical protein